VAAHFGSVLKSTRQVAMILIMQKRIAVSVFLLAWFWLGALVIPGHAQNSQFSRFQNHWQPDQYLNVEHGQIESSPILPGWFSAMWSLENVDGGFVRIRNRWKPEQYLNVEHGQIESSPIAPGWFSAMWSFENVDGGFVRIRNRWKPEQYLNVEHGQIESGPIAPGWFSAMWSIVPVQ
jgi:hypothetical protein